MNCPFQPQDCKDFSCHGYGGGCNSCPSCHSIELTEGERSFLSELAQVPFLPLACFLMASTKPAYTETVALSPVYLLHENETLARVKETRLILLALQAKGLVSLDYHQPLQGCGYEVYQNSNLYRGFAAMVRAGIQKDGLLFDLPELELGSVALTALGQQAVEQLPPA